LRVIEVFDKGDYAGRLDFIIHPISAKSPASHNTGRRDSSPTFVFPWRAFPMKTRRGPAGRGPSRKSRSFSRPVLERVEDRLLLTVFTVNNTSDDNVNPNPGSLRQAIIDSNNDTSSLPNQIVFDLPTGLQTITPVAPFDDITQPVIIDGTTAS